MCSWLARIYIGVLEHQEKYLSAYGPNLYGPYQPSPLVRSFQGEVRGTLLLKPKGRGLFGMM